MKKARRSVTVINCSAPSYNLGARKMADWLRHEGALVDYHDGDPGLLLTESDVIALSVIFSWHAPRAREIALRWREEEDSSPACSSGGVWVCAACADETTRERER